MKFIVISFILSISIHLIFFKNYKTNQEPKQIKNIEKVKETNIKYVQIKKSDPKEKIKTKEKQVLDEKTYIKAKEKIPFQKKRTKKTNNKPLENTSFQQKTLEDFLSQKDPIDKNMLSQIERLYGREFETYTNVQKVFIEKNLDSFRVITQRVLNRLGYPPVAAKMLLTGTNIVEFIFYPDGSIKNLKISSSSGYSIFDDYTLELIQIAYKNYPKPKTPTKLIFNVHYRLY